MSRAPRRHLLVVSYPCSTAINQDFFAHVDEETGCFSMTSAATRFASVVESAIESRAGG